MRISDETVSFDVTARDEALIEKIAKRAERLDRESKWGMRRSLTDWQMDLTACHANGSPIDLAKLLAASDLTFAHDAFGIARHLDRRTGELMSVFVPRCARSDEERLAA